MTLDKDTYFAPPANAMYMSASQVKRFMVCEACALAELEGRWVQEPTTALLVGSYVDAHFSGEMGEFIEAHPEICTRSGELKAEYRQANTIIARIERDPLMMEYLQGEKQVIKTGEIRGIPFKIKIDVLHTHRIVDLKIMRDFKPLYVEGQGRLTFIEAWGYDVQGAIYQAVEGHRLPFYIAAATKEPEPDIGIFEIPQHYLDAAMEVIEPRLERFQLVKLGLTEPTRCEKCDYCKHTKTLSRALSVEELAYE